MTKKILALALALILALAVGSVSVASAEGDPYEVVWLRYGSVGTTDVQPGLKDVQAAANEWLAAHGYNFTIDMMHVRDANNIQLQLAAQDHIDVFWQNAGTLADTLLAGNFLYDIGDIYKNYEGLYNSMPEKIWNTLLRNGGKSLYQIPCYKESGIATAVCIKKSDAERFGWDAFINDDHTKPWRMADFTPYLEEGFATGDYEQAFYISTLPLFNGSRDYILMDDIAGVNAYIGIDLSGDTTKAQLVTDIPAFQDYCKLMAEWNEAGYIYEGFATGTASKDISWLFMGETLTPDFQANMDNRYAKYDENGIYYVILTDTYLGSNSALGSGYAIASYTPNIDACMNFMDVLYGNTEFADLCLYGIEGVHYNRLEDGSCEKIADSGYNFATWATSNVMTVSLENTDSPDKKEAYAAFNDGAKDSILLGFVFDQSAVEAEIAACAGVVTEYQKLVEWGFYGEDGINEYANALKAAGAETVLAEVQRQLDEFFAAK